MNLKKLMPWSWFKKEEEAATLPVKRVASLSYPLAQLHCEIDRLFDHVFRNIGWPWAEIGHTIVEGGIVPIKPYIDIAATDREYFITAEVPGLEPEDLHLELLDDTLLIRGEKRQEWEKQHAGVYRMERRYGTFERVLSLPEDADRDHLDARLKNGVLTVAIPRKQSARATSRVIEVRKAG